MVQVSPHRRIAIGTHITTTCFASRQFAARPNVVMAAGWLVMLSRVLCCYRLALGLGTSQICAFSQPQKERGPATAWKANFKIDPCAPQFRVAGWSAAAATPAALPQFA